MFVVPKVLKDKRILLVDDEVLVTLVIEEILEDCGCITVGPYRTLEAALHAVQSEVFDAAILDVNLAGTRVDPVAYALAERDIPFLFLSGYGDNIVWPDHPNWKVCAKPFVTDDLIGMIAAMIDTSTPQPDKRDTGDTRASGS